MNKPSKSEGSAPLVYLGYWHGKWYGGDRGDYTRNTKLGTHIFYAPDVDDVFGLPEKKLVSEFELLQMASVDRWKDFYYQLTGKRPQTMKGWEWKVVNEGLQCMASRVGDKRFAPEMLRKIGIWRARFGGEDGLAYNNGDRLFFLPEKKRVIRILGLYQPPCIFKRSAHPRPNLNWNLNGESAPLSTEDSARVLDALQKQPWAGEAQLEGAELAGWIYSSLFTAIPMAAEQLPCSMPRDFVNWRPQIWLTGTMTIAKRVLVEDLEHILGGGLCTKLQPNFSVMEWGVTMGLDLWRMLSETAAPVIYLDEEPEEYLCADVDAHRMRCLEVMAEVAHICAESSQTGRLNDGWYRICNSFCIVTDKGLTYSESGEFRLTELRLKDTTRAREEKLAAALVDVRKMIDAPEFTARFLLRCMMVYPLYRETFAALTAYFVEKFKYGADYLYASQMIRHAQLIAGAHAMRADEPMTAEEMEVWAEMVRAKMRRENEATRAEREKSLSRRR